MMDKLVDSVTEMSKRMSMLQDEIKGSVTKTDCSTCQMRCQQAFEKTLANLQKYFEINLEDIKNALDKIENQYGIDRRFLLEKLEKIYEKTSWPKDHTHN